MNNLNMQSQFNSEHYPLFIKEGGTKTGQPIIFIHGLLGSHIYWQKQFNDNFLNKHHLVAYDLRGHGLSVKLTHKTDYNNAKAWADDLNEVIKTLNLFDKKVILVGWSLGCAVISDYINVYSINNIKAVIYIEPMLDFQYNLNTKILTPLYTAMLNHDLNIRLRAISTFIQKCFYKKIEDSLFHALLVNAGMASEVMLKNFSHNSGAFKAISDIKSHNIPMKAIFGKKSALLQVQPSVNFLNKIIFDNHTILTPSQKYQYEFVTIQDAGHAVYIEAPNQLSDYINEMIYA